MLIGVVSDTHGYLNPRVPELLAGVEHILHAGDIGDAGIIDELATKANYLRKPAPLTAGERAKKAFEGENGPHLQRVKQGKAWKAAADAAIGDMVAKAIR